MALVEINDVIQLIAHSMYFQHSPIGGCRGKMKWHLAKMYCILSPATENVTEKFTRL